MATVTGSESLAVADWDHGSESKSDRYLAARLAAASADYKGVAMATFTLAVAVTAVAWLVLGVLAEHWLVPGGLPVPARWLWLCLGLAALVAAVVRWVVPLVRYRVNLVYAARVIEHDHPELHNDLVNAVLVKAHPDGASPRVARMLERRAAKRLTAVPADGIADRGLALKLTVALAVLVGSCCIYQLVAPKSLVVSAARLVAPWWGIAAPARVTIKEPRLAWRMPPDDAGGERPAHPLQVSRGAGSLIRGRQLLVETDVTGLRGDERPTLEVTPIRDDGTVDAAAAWRVSLTAAGRSAAMATVLPDAVRGLQHGVELVVTAGDARSDRIRVAVVDTPTLLVREVRYEFPAYTGKPPETVAWQGDLRAPEFTKVTLTAESNRPLDVAWVDPECAGRESERKRLRIGQHDLSRAIGEFPLRMNADRTGPEFASYRLGFRPRAAAGAPETEIVEKLEQRVEVIPDLPPEVTIEAPDDAIRVPPSAPVAIRVRAVDPDYGVARVFVEARVDGAPVRPEARLLEKPHAGVFNGTVEIVPERLGAIAGRKLEYRAVVEDTRPERPGRAESPWRTLQIDITASPQPRDRQAMVEERRNRPDGQSGEQARGVPNGSAPQGGRGAVGKDQAGDQPSGDAGAQNVVNQVDSRLAEEQNAEDRTEADQQHHANTALQRNGEQPGQEGERGSNQGPGPSNSGPSGSVEGSQPQSEQSGSGAGARQIGAGARRSPDGEQGSASGQQAEESVRGAPKAAGRDPVAADGTNDGEAIERILETRKSAAPDVEKSLSRKGGPFFEQQTAEGTAKDVNGDIKGDNTDNRIREREREDGSVDRSHDVKGDVENARIKTDHKSDGESDSELSEKGIIQSENELKGRAVNLDLEKNGLASGKKKSERRDEGDKSTSLRTDVDVDGLKVRSENSAQGDFESRYDRKGDESGIHSAEYEVKDITVEGSSSRRGEGKRQEKREGDSHRNTDTRQKIQGKTFATSPEGQNQERQKPQQRLDGPKQQSPEGQPECVKADGKPCHSADCAACAKRHSGAEQSGGAPGSAGEAGPAVSVSPDGQADSSPGAVSIRGEHSANATSNGISMADRDQAEDATSLVATTNDGHGGVTTNIVGGGAPDGSGVGGTSRNLTLFPLGRDDRPLREMQWGPQESDDVRNAVDLALEHLRDSVNQGRTDVLDELGWTPEQARAFIERWQKMRSLAESGDPVQRGEFERAVRSLGLRPNGVRSGRDVPADRKGGEAEGRRSRPPAAYREQVEAYLRGTGGG